MFFFSLPLFQSSLLLLLSRFVLLFFSENKSIYVQNPGMRLTWLILGVLVFGLCYNVNAGKRDSGNEVNEKKEGKQF